MKALSHRKQQKGAVLILVTVALFVLLAFTALALDGGYLLLNKTRVQDAVDSAALSGAKTLDDGGSHADAEQAVYDTLSTIFTGEGFSAVNVDIDNLADAVTIEFSTTVYPGFTDAPGDPDARYIRVILDTVPVTQFLSQIVLDVWQVGASAVAGASPPIENPCQLIPLLMCAGDLENKNSPDYTFGFTPSDENDRGDILVIKAPNHNATSAVGPGNFLALDFGDVGGGANEFRDGLAGNIHDGQCSTLLEDGELRTKTGNMVGPTETGLNTRFGEYSGNMREPLDAPTNGGADAYYADCAVPNYAASTGLELVNFNGTEFDNPDGTSSVLPEDSGLVSKLQGYNDYFNNVHSTSPTTQHCLPKRRQVSVPVADCTGHNPGSTNLELIGFACMFLSQKVTGSTGTTQFIVAEFVKNCTSEGGGFSDSTSGLDRLVLYKDPDGKGA
ncbi:pilus assembly protein TadG-related protein [Zobellella sp. DQSA1]|uniref:pilus assembly protein TadG-related protein n=1 Tax=Zobellella sp. DQSA1 TaxID=3342386 RepID=UPI0035BFB5F2